MEDFFFWQVSPIIFKATVPILNYNLQIRYYGVFFASAALGSFLLWRWQMLRAGYKDREVDAWFIISIIAVIAGAHLGHVIFYNLDYYLANPWEIIFFKGRGLSSHGATIGALTGLLVYSRLYKLPILEVLDANAFSAALAAMLVRLGNFFNHEIVGRVTDVPWAVRFKYFADNGELARHPSQLYEFTLGVVVLVCLLLVDRHYGSRRPRGLLSAVFALTYFPGRFLVEFFKEYHRLDPSQSFLTMGQYLSIPFTVLGLFFLIYALKTGPQDPLAWSRQKEKKVRQAPKTKKGKKRKRKK